MITTGEVGILGAAAALIVAITDRGIASFVVERRRQRDYRRAIYGRFAAGCNLAKSYIQPGWNETPEGVQIGHDIAAALAEIQLAAPVEIIAAAQLLVDLYAVGTLDKAAVTVASDKFVALARRNTR